MKRNIVTVSTATGGESVGTGADRGQDGAVGGEREGSLPRVICETPVTIFEDLRVGLGAPRRTVQYLSRTQIPPTELLNREWSLEDYGVRGRWGYAFKYEIGDLYLYQRTEDDAVNHPNTLASLTSSDWSIMRHLKIHTPRVLPTITEEDEEEEEGEEKHTERRKKRARLDVTHTEKRMVYCAVWQSKTSPSGRWYFRACLYGSDSSVDGDDFVLEYFNSDCGVFVQVLSMPHAAWMEQMKEALDCISCLFRSCRNWKESLVVKKAISF